MDVATLGLHLEHRVECVDLGFERMEFDSWQGF